MAAVPPPSAMMNSPSPNNSQAPTQLEFNDAMKSFKNMFPGMDRDVIEAVLRANNGLVDATIDQLLDMGAGEIESAAVDSNSAPHLPAYTTSHLHEPPPSYSDVVSTEQTSTSNNNNKNNNTRPLPSRPYAAWNPPLLGALPDDFLRLMPTRSEAQHFQVHPKADQKRNNAVTTPEKELDQFHEDEKLAMFLQNEEFMRELRRNEDFVLSLERDRARKIANSAGANEAVPINRSTEKQLTSSTQSTYPPTSNPLAKQQEWQVADSATAGRLTEAGATGGRGHEDEAIGATGGHASSPVAGHDDAAFREKLKHMGKSTRKKFDKLARVFSRRKHTQRDVLVASAGGSASTANLLEDYEDDDLIHMGSGRLELMDERDEENGNSDEKSNSAKVISQGGQTRTTNPTTVEPIIFFAEDNEFQLKEER